MESDGAASAAGRKRGRKGGRKRREESEDAVATGGRDATSEEETEIDAPRASAAGAAPRAEAGPLEAAGAEGTIHRWVLAAAAAAATGVALVGTGPSEAGKWLAVLGGLGLIAAIHRLGRLGPA